MQTITIENTKGIQHLEFSVPEKSGLYLLVGQNGSGKTTLLTCLDRICNSKAFTQGFRTSSSNGEVDQYRDAKIKYTGKTNEEVTYSKKPKKWPPKPRENVAVLKSFGFKSSVFIKAEAHRISVPNQEILQGRTKPASPDIISAMNDLFETDKYDGLRRLNVNNKRGNAAKYFYVITTKVGMYSERSFSTGEIALLRLADALKNVRKNSLILLDEAELALHPRVQMNLLDYMKEICKDKELTIVISTHSPTMINYTNPANIILLEEEEQGKYHAVTPCAHAYATGAIALPENVAPDLVICVEDDMARLLLEALIKRFQKTNSISLTYCTIPVAGWQQTAEYAANANKILSQQSRYRAVLDHDVFDEREKLHILKPYSGLVFDLGTTPELGIIQAIEKGSGRICKEFNKAFRIDLVHLLSKYKCPECAEHQGARKLAKLKFKFLLGEIDKKSISSHDENLRKLVNVISQFMYSDAQVRSIVQPIFNTKH